VNPSSEHSKFPVKASGVPRNADVRSEIDATMTVP